METEFSIQQVAELTGLSIDTLRYYERIGLLEKVGRAPSGHRRYRQRDIDWIGLLINLRETGMPLAEMLHFAQLRRQGDATAPERLLLHEQHQRSLEQQMQKLEQRIASSNICLCSFNRHGFLLFQKGEKRWAWTCERWPPPFAAGRVLTDCRGRS